MLIHTYFTDGFYEFGKIFIQSFKNLHGERFPMIATTRNLKPKQIQEIKKLYRNIIVLNKKIPMIIVSERAGVDIKTLKKYKHEIEYDRLNRQGNVIWKQYISVEDRYRNSILEAMKYSKDEKFMMHIDADSYIKKRLDPIFNIILKNDVTLIFRLDKKLRKKIYGCLSGFKLGDKADLFMKTWIKYIDKIPLREKPIGYGQIACYYAYCDLKISDIKWGSIPRNWVSTKPNKNLLVWEGSHPRGKTRTTRLFKKELQHDKK